MNAGSTTYVVQKEFSNLQNDCVSAPPVFTLSTPAAGVGPSLPFNGTLTHPEQRFALYIDRLHRHGPFHQLGSAGNPAGRLHFPCG